MTTMPLLLLALGVQPPAPPARAARLLVTVIDPSGGVIPSATVTVIGLDASTKAAAIAPVKTSVKGVVTIDALAPGRYRIQAEFPGFEAGLLQNVSVRPGDNRHVVVLTIKRVTESVDVARDAQVAASDPRGNTFKTTLTTEEIDALSDDPTEMAQQLQDMAGGNAVIRVDSFLGAPLPPKAQIKSIHIVRDAFAAENHSAENEGIDIITAPGTGPLRVNGSSRFRDGSMSGQSPFTPTKGPERTQNYEANFGGTIVKDKSSFSLNLGSRRSFDTPVLNVALPGGVMQSVVLNVQRPDDRWSARGLFDYALTRNHVLRMAFDAFHTDRGNQGIGAFDLPERAFSTESRTFGFRAMEVGPMGRRAFGNTRMELQWSRSDSHAAIEAPTIRVNDAFTSGGAQVAGGRRALDFEAASDIDYIRGIHSFRGGVVFEGGQFRTDDAANYLGTYVFTSLAAYDARQPATYTRRIGDPLVDYFFLRSGVYLQDDIRVSKTLTLSPGVRYEAEAHVHDFGKIGPRFGFNWSPTKSGRTTLRGSAGIFSNWVNQNTYEQTLRIDGFRQQELDIVNPRYPDPGTVGLVGTTNKYLFGDDVQMSRTFRVSTGIDQTLTPNVRVSFGYMAVRGVDVLHGVNVNAPDAARAGVRPDPAFANVIALASDAATHTNQFSTTVNVNLSPGRAPSNPPRWNWRRTNLRFNYWLAEITNNSDGPFSVSPTGELTTEWGPAVNDRRHRAAVAINSQMLRDLNTTLSLATFSGQPYTITTGLDRNGDSIFNDRPAGIGRNSVRADGQVTWNLNAAYTVRMGGLKPAAMQDGPRDRGDAQAANASRYRLTFNVNVTNLTNHSNFTGFSGVMTSPFFEQPTAVLNPRKVDIGMTFGF